MSTNPYISFLALLPSYPLQIASVTAVEGEVARLALPDGGVRTVRGAATAKQRTAHTILSSPAAVPGDACASAQVRVVRG